MGGNWKYFTEVEKLQSNNWKNNMWLDTDTNETQQVVQNKIGFCDKPFLFYT